MSAFSQSENATFDDLSYLRRISCMPERPTFVIKEISQFCLSHNYDRYSSFMPCICVPPTMCRDFPKKSGVCVFKKLRKEQKMICDRENKLELKSLAECLSFMQMSLMNET